MIRGGWAFMIGAVLLGMGCTTTGGPTPSDPKHAAALNARLGLAYMEQGDYELAMAKLKHALTLDGDSANAHHYIAELYKKLGKNREAEDHFRKALALAPADPMLLNNFGVFLCRQHRLDEALDKFVAAAKQPFYRTPEVAYTNAGLCALEVPDLVKAEDYFREALGVNPRMADALYGMADIKFKQREYLHSRAFLQRYLDVAPANPSILWLGVRVERRLGDEASAAKYAKLLQEKFPASEEAALLQGRKAP